ncbi:hypothetical protein BDQ17DRAFT_1387052 [Cyathus striatus]|nr:hypothetical protein BDQ17DRAFT_1387052 [Cyathus striatus]
METDKIPDLSGKVVIVTGGNTGIGKATAKALLEHNAKRAAIEELHAETGKHAIFLKLDLADLKSVKAATEEFTSKETELHILFNNAGVMFLPMEELVNGYDPQIFTNMIIQRALLFTKLLLPFYFPPQEIASRDRQVVNTSSSGMYTSGATLDFASFKDGPVRNKYKKWNMYFQSNIQTEINRSVSKWSFSSLGLFILQRYPAETGALTQLWAGTSPRVLNLAARWECVFLIPWARMGRARPDSDDPQLGKDLWTWLEEQVAGN